MNISSMKKAKKDFNELWVEHSNIGIEKLLKSIYVFKGVSWAEYGVGGRTCLELEQNGSGNIIVNGKTIFSFNNLKELALKSDELNNKYPFKIG